MSLGTWSTQTISPVFPRFASYLETAVDVESCPYASVTQNKNNWQLQVERVSCQLGAEPVRESVSNFIWFSLAPSLTDKDDEWNGSWDGFLDSTSSMPLVSHFTKLKMFSSDFSWRLFETHCDVINFGVFPSCASITAHWKLPTCFICWKLDRWVEQAVWDCVKSVNSWQTSRNDSRNLSTKFSPRTFRKSPGVCASRKPLNVIVWWIKNWKGAQKRNKANVEALLLSV